MTTGADLFRYDVLVQDALRGVIRKILNEVECVGIPGEHHFYISFDTTFPGIKMSPRLKARYPKEMTIVLQHQFWGLKTSSNGFDVNLSFDGIPESLSIPFHAIKGFYDPSVQFVLHFDVVHDQDSSSDEQDSTGTTKNASITELNSQQQVSAQSKDANYVIYDTANLELSEISHENNKSDVQKPQDVESEKVISLDRFRKKG